jgi:hypothetical protein
LAELAAIAALHLVKAGGSSGIAPVIDPPRGLVPLSCAFRKRSNWALVTPAPSVPTVAICPLWTDAGGVSVESPQPARAITDAAATAAMGVAVRCFAVMFMRGSIAVP